MPRRKYGHMVGPLPGPPKPDKCRFCRHGRPCPYHRRQGEQQKR